MSTNIELKHLEKYKINFITKSFNNKNSNSANAKGYIEIFTEENDWLISGIFIKFEYLEIDQYTTKSWFEKKDKNKNFKTREELFKKLKIEQICRPNSNSNKLKKLDEKELEIVNNFFNERYFSENQNNTIKNIISILKGNNAGGSLQTPKNAEMIVNVDDKNNKYKNLAFNFFMCIDIILKNQKLWKKKIKKEEYDYLKNKLEPKNFNEFIDKFSNRKNEWHNKNFENFYDLLKISNKIKTEEITKKEWKFTTEIIKSSLNTLKSFKEKVIDKCVLMERNKINKLKVEIFDVSKIDERIPETEKAHIFDVKYIKRELEQIIICLYEKNKNIKSDEIESNKQFKEILKYVSDKSNLLNLTRDLHSKFDKNEFTYNVNGEIQIINKTFKLNTYEKPIFQKINNEKLNEKMIFFIKERNNSRKISKNNP